MNYILIIVCLCLLIIFGILLQVVYIRSRLHEYSTGNVQRKVDAQNTAHSLAKEESKLRVYGIVVDFDLCAILSSAGSSLQEAINLLINQENVAIPYVCDAGVRNVPAQIDKVALLVLKSNKGAETLQNDLINDQIKYIVINQEVYMAKVFEGLRDHVIAPHFRDMNMISTSEKFNDRIIIVLYSLANHTVLDPSVVTEDCMFSIHPFIGAIKQKGGSSKFIDVASGILGGLSQGANQPLHIIGYKTI
jgi:hypothetical protein